jgi:hypothetical protein
MMRLNANAPKAVRASVGGRRSRDKGARAERALVRFLQAHGFAAERVPMSGAAGGRFAGDITIPLLGVDRITEVKVRGTGFRQLYEWLDGRDLLIVRADRREPLVVLPLRLGVEVAKAGEQSKTPLSSPTSSPDAAIATINTLSAIEAEPASSIGGALRNAMT